jgi:hypothetical protein
MSKGPTGIENPKLHVIQPTQDGKWFVAIVSDGTTASLASNFVGAKDDAQAIAEYKNRQEHQRYERELRDQWIGDKE